MKGHNIMPKNVETVQPHIPPPTSVPIYTAHITGEDWAHINKTTGEVKIHPGKINTVILPENGNPKSTDT